jgi:hypothetical protein
LSTKTKGDDQPNDNNNIIKNHFTFASKTTAAAAEVGESVKRK